MPTWQDIPHRRLFVVRGVPVSIDLTFLFAALTVLIAILRREFPSIWDYPLTFAIVLLGLFLSVLLHELGHIVAARRFGLMADEIRVGGFYGLAFLYGLARTRLEAILILAAGPAMNGVLFLVFWAFLGAPDITGHLYFGEPRYSTPVLDIPALRASTQWLGYLNFGMLLFNLMPAFPLDGGRIARILIEKASSFWTSVRIVAACGLFIGVWSAFGMLAYPALMFVGPFLVLSNWMIWKGELAPPRD